MTTTFRFMVKGGRFSLCDRLSAFILSESFAAMSLSTSLIEGEREGCSNLSLTKRCHREGTDARARRLAARVTLRKKPRKEQIGREREKGDKVVRSHCRRHHRLVFCLAPSSPSEPHIQGKCLFREDRFCECMTVLLRCSPWKS